MNRIFYAALFAAPLLLSSPLESFANPRQSVGPFGHRGFCPGFHQHGPLFNYGPYYGYPPFEPYGPWNAYLQYNPYYYGNGSGDGGHDGSGGGLKGLFNRDKSGCHGSGCGLAQGWHAHWASGGWFGGRGCVSCGHGKLGGLFHHGSKKGCSTCEGSTPVITTTDPIGTTTTSTPTSLNTETIDPVARYTGYGAAADSTIFYAGLPSLNPNAVTPAGGFPR